MEVKILCPCGAKYKFDVEPLHGKLPGPVQCPVCATDGTAAGNAIVAQQLAARTAAAAAMPAGASGANAGEPRIVIPVVPKSNNPISISKPATPAPTPIQVGASAPASLAPPPPPPSVRPVAPSSGSGTALSVASIAPAHPAPVHAAAAPVAPVAGGALSQAKSIKALRAAGANNTMGIIGAVVAGLVGMFVWFGITIATNREFGLLAWGLGGLIGAVARGLGRGVSNPLGLAAGAVAFVTILGGQYLATRHITNSFMTLGVPEMYGAQVAYAKEVSAAKNDEELKAVIAKHESEDDEPVKPSDIDATRLAEFKKTELPELRKFSEGKMTQAEFEKKHREDLEQVLGTGFVLKESFSLWTLLWLFFGVGTAYRLGSGNE
jgi:hypothetical protein